MQTADIEILAQPSMTTTKTLLEAAGLPTADLTEAHLGHLFFAAEAGSALGVVGVELYGEHALLRSLAVTASNRSRGLGCQLLTHAESFARSRGAKSVFLLTETAEPYFLRLGYQMADRKTAPESIRTTREFAGLCPASSSLMSKAL